MWPSARTSAAVRQQKSRRTSSSAQQRRSTRSIVSSTIARTRRSSMMKDLSTARRRVHCERCCARAKLKADMAVSEDRLAQSEALIRALPLVAARFELAGSLGEGTLGPAFRARDPGRGRVLVLKRLGVAARASPGGLVRFLSEARAIASLEHPRVATLVEMARDEEGPFIARELIEGTTLAALLAERGPLAVRDAAA